MFVIMLNVCSRPPVPNFKTTNSLLKSQIILTNCCAGNRYDAYILHRLAWNTMYAKKITTHLKCLELVIIWAIPAETTILPSKNEIGNKFCFYKFKKNSHNGQVYRGRH